MKNKKPEKTLTEWSAEIVKLFDHPRNRPNPFRLKDYIEKSLKEDEKLMPEEGDNT